MERQNKHFSGMSKRVLLDMICSLCHLISFVSFTLQHLCQIT